MSYRLSTYSIPLEWDKNKYIFSSRSKVLVKIPTLLWNGLIEGKGFSMETLSSNKMIEKLYKTHILATEKEDELFYDKMKIDYLRSSFQTSHLSLTILPTQSCNLRCPYCFEGEKKSVSMTEAVQEAIIKFITTRPIKTYSITWFGGEPLLRPDIIESILEKLSKYLDKRLTHHSIVTNGTLLNKRAENIFSHFPLDSIQITLDGKKKEHDLLRCDAKGNGTFEIIKKNIITFAKRFPSTHISVRVNVTKDNMTDFYYIYAGVSGWFKANGRTNYNIYPGIIKIADENIEVNSCLNRIEQQEFYLDLNNKGISFFGYPKNKSGGCTATTSMSMVVGAQGDIYKCWEDVGKDNLAVGSLMDNNTHNDALLSNYLLKGSKFANEECKRCGYLPICSGGCPKERISRNLVKPNQCSLYSINEGRLLKVVLRTKLKL
ncbi:MAG: SPASM domain-containing protein [Muribaculaceae bacterium]|nr:SPASM domain-containing protein [Muribaculaceae bacterium]